MTIADYAARFSPQIGLAFPEVPRPVSTRPQVLEHPTREVLAAAARENECVREFIADGLMTWSAERVERDPPCYLVYEHGEVVGNFSDLVGMARHAEKRKGIGLRKGVRPLSPDDEVLPYNIGLRRLASHPRQRRWLQRMALKSLLPPYAKPAVSSAMHRNQRDFVAWVLARPGLRSSMANTTGLTPKQFWRAVRGHGA
ncbi:MAG: hypothetical protein AB1941_00980 [Gemmatimonadota bacterium]